MSKTNYKSVEHEESEKNTQKANEIASKPNLEDKHPFVLNLFYCFFMTFVCRIKPITNEDIYQIGERDMCSSTSNLVEKSWNWQQKQRQMKEPAKPSLFKILLIRIGGVRLLLAIFFLILSVGFQICQPSMMKQVLKQVTLKMMQPDGAKFPYTYTIILMASLFLSSLFDTLSNRLIYHISSNLRSSLAGMIYRKVLKMNLSSQSNVNTGRLLSLLSADTNQMATMSPMFFYMSTIPVQ
ncbi:MAG: hypothetical protein EZS28_015235, partial [Streblomastix strix]